MLITAKSLHYQVDKTKTQRIPSAGDDVGKQADADCWWKSKSV